MSEFYEQIICESCNQYSVVIEDDERVCYAYLLLGERILGHVWLYNQQATPIETEWKRDEMPFLNPLEYIDERNILSPIVDEGDVTVEYYFWDENCSLVQVEIMVRGKLAALLKPGSKLGWSMGVKKTGPVAKIFLDEAND